MRASFGDLVLDTDERRVRRGETALPLTPKQLDVLALLVRRAPRAVSKAEIRDVVWPRTFVTESNLTSLVTSLRAALGDDVRAPRFIRTVYGFGYALVAPVQSGGESAAPAVPAGAGPLLLVDGRHVPLRAGENLLGRTDGVVVWLPSATASRRHARIVVSAGAATLEDLGSKNGTFLGGRRIAGPEGLADGDVVEAGGARLVYRTAAGSESTRTDAR